MREPVAVENLLLLTNKYAASGESGPFGKVGMYAPKSKCFRTIQFSDFRLFCVWWTQWRNTISYNSQTCFPVFNSDQDE